MELQGRVALVTGSSRGLGRATALELARRGAHVAINCHESLEEGKAVAREIIDLGRESMCIEADVSNVDQVNSMVEQIIEKWSRIDILVNNAGILRDRTLRRMSVEEWQEVLAVNLGGVFNCSRAVLQHMLEAKSGRIVSMTSVVAKSGNFGQTNYAASKAGVIGFTKSLALETAARGITVNCVAPGFIKTHMTDSIPGDVIDIVKSRIPMGDLGEPADIAHAVAFLVSDAARYITGQVIDVNGGLYM